MKTKLHNPPTTKARLARLRRKLEDCRRACVRSKREGTVAARLLAIRMQIEMWEYFGKIIPK